MFDSIIRSKAAKGLVGILSPLVLASGIYFSTPKFSHANPVSDFLVEETIGQLIDSTGVINDLTGGKHKTYKEAIKDIGNSEDEKEIKDNKKKEIWGALYLKDGTILKNVRCKNDEFVFVREGQILKVPKEKILIVDFSREKNKDILYLKDKSVIKNVQYLSKNLEISSYLGDMKIDQDQIRTLIFKQPKQAENPKPSIQTKKPVLTKDEIVSLFGKKVNKEKNKYDITSKDIKLEQGEFTTSEEPEAIVSFIDNSQCKASGASEVWLLRFRNGKWEVDRRLAESDYTKFETVDIQRDGKLEILVKEGSMSQGYETTTSRLISIDGRTTNVLYSNKGWDNTSAAQEGEALKEYTIKFFDTDKDRILEIIETEKTETYAQTGKEYKKTSSKSKETIYKLKGNKYVKISDTNYAPRKEDSKPATVATAQTSHPILDNMKKLLEATEQDREYTLNDIHRAIIGIENGEKFLKDTDNCRKKRMVDSKGRTIFIAPEMCKSSKELLEIDRERKPRYEKQYEQVKDRINCLRQMRREAQPEYYKIVREIREGNSTKGRSDLQLWETTWNNRIKEQCPKTYKGY